MNDLIDLSQMLHHHRRRYTVNHQYPAIHYYRIQYRRRYLFEFFDLRNQYRYTSYRSLSLRCRLFDRRHQNRHQKRS